MTETLELKNRELLRFTTAGSVDDGKSTLIGRMLYDSKSIFQDQIDGLERTRQLRGEEDINLAYLTDGLRSEREQGITIDVAYRYFSTPKRKFIIADTPGHEQYTRNMVTGASTADLAVILIDAQNGVLTQSRRHGFISSLLGIPHVIVAVNKMDLIDYNEDIYNRIVDDYIAFSEKLNIHDIIFVPVSALKGDNIVNKSDKMPWYDGGTILYHLENVTISPDRNLVDFRFPIQYVLRPDHTFRGFAGEIASGTISKNEKVAALPSGKISEIENVYTVNGEVEEAFESEAVVLTLKDEIDLSRGDMLVRLQNLPVVSNRFEAILCWMDDQQSLSQDRPYILQHTTNRVQAYVRSLRHRINVNSLHRENVDTLSLNEIGRVEIETGTPLFFDSYEKNRKTGGFILIDPETHMTAAAGMIREETRTVNSILKKIRQSETKTSNMKSQNTTLERSHVGLEERQQSNDHKAHVIWLTGLSGSGKSTISRELESRLFQKGQQVYILDGDNIRNGLNGDLGFTKEDRIENIRRIGYVANLFYKAGFIVICAFISPQKEMRDFVRDIFPEKAFSEVYVKCSLDTCKERDPKKLYERALSGEIKEFTGISAPYEEPDNAELVLNTDKLSLKECLSLLESYLEKKVGLSD